MDPNRLFITNQELTSDSIRQRIDLDRPVYFKSAYIGAYMARVNLTAGRVADYQCEPGKAQSFLWDAKCHCLAVRATRNGAKAYVCQAKLHGKDIRVTLGAADVWTIGDAREAATRFKVTVDQGVDPRVVAADARSAADAESAERVANKVIARTAWDDYLKAPHPKWGVTHRKDHEIAAQEGGQKPKRGKALTKPGPLTTLLALPLRDITADVVSGWLQKESASRATAAGNSLRKFRTFINWCAEHPVYKRAVHADCATAKVVTELAPAKMTKHDDALQKEQLAAWFKQVRTIENPALSAYLQGLLLTGARRTEWQRLKWTDLDFNGKKLTIRDKVEGHRTIPLTPYLASLLNALPRKTAFVFGSTSSTQRHVIGVSKPHAKAVSRAGLPHVSLHGLRRSFATLSEWLELPVGVVAQIQGHKPSAIAEKHYKRRPIDLLRMHHEKFENWMLRQGKVARGASAAD
jgi:integrase